MSRLSGGLAIYIHNKHSAHIRSDLNDMSPELESLFVELNCSPRNVIVGSLYRRPKSNFRIFLTKLREILSKVNAERKLIYITGDLNVDLLRLDSGSNELCSAFNESMLYNCVTKPTRVSNTSATLLDHIWTNNLSNLLESNIIYARTSDHFSVYCTFRQGSNQLNIKKTQILYSRSFWK